MEFSWIEVTIITIIILLLAAGGWAIYSESQRPTIEIKKEDWDCVQSVNRMHMQPMLVGKVTIMQPMISTVCTEYRRHAG